MGHSNSIGGGEMTQARRPAEVNGFLEDLERQVEELECQVEELECQVEELERQLDQLHTRIGPILRNIPSEVPPLEDEETLDSPMGKTLGDIAGRVRMAHRRVRYMLEMLAVE